MCVCVLKLLFKSDFLTATRKGACFDIRTSTARFAKKGREDRFMNIALLYTPIG